MKNWFITWNRPEYKEWASKIKDDYYLVIIRKEKNRYLCSKAKLIFESKGLPVFESLKDIYAPTSKEAINIIKQWQLSI